MKPKRIILGVTGSIAAYKSGDLIRKMRREGARVICVLTKTAEQFITPVALRSLTGEWVYPELELVRMAIPRRVYTQSHLDYVVRVVAELWQKRHQIRGVKIVYQTKFLRHFTARFEPV